MDKKVNANIFGFGGIFMCLAIVGMKSWTEERILDQSFLRGCLMLLSMENAECKLNVFELSFLLWNKTIFLIDKASLYKKSRTTKIYIRFKPYLYLSS